jgi:hypothetical protein
MKNLLNAHIRQTTFECSAEREIRLYKNAESRSTVIMIASALVVVGLLVAGVAYAASGPKLSVAVGSFANEKIALTLDTGNGCVAGEYVAARIVRDQPTVNGCWMQPTPDDVRVRWLSTTEVAGPGSFVHDHYSMSSFETKHIEIR